MPDVPNRLSGLSHRSRAFIHRCPQPRWRLSSARAAGWAHERSQRRLGAGRRTGAARRRRPRRGGRRCAAVAHVDRPSEPQGVDGRRRPCCSTRRRRRCADLRCRGAPASSCRRAEPEAGDWEAAIAVGAQRVITLPEHDGEFVGRAVRRRERAATRTGAARSSRVIGGRGGAGASLFATAWRSPPPMLCSSTPTRGVVASIWCGLRRPAGSAVARPHAAGRPAELRRVARRVAATTTGSACCRVVAPATTSSRGRWAP